MVDWDRVVSRTVSAEGKRRGAPGTDRKHDVAGQPWSSWKTVPAKGRVKGSSRFLQYEVKPTGPAGSAAPELRAIGFTANGGEVIHPGETR